MGCQRRKRIVDSVLDDNAHITSTQRYLHVGVDQGREELNKNIRFNIAAPLG
jgi:hypothetical protein